MEEESISTAFRQWDGVPHEGHVVKQHNGGEVEDLGSFGHRWWTDIDPDVVPIDLLRKDLDRSNHELCVLLSVPRTPRPPLIRYLLDVAML